MVRETRHLWVGNLPDNIREERIREHFKRYGRVQSVKFLPRGGKEETNTCTVAFMDIKSASMAHKTENKLDDRTLTTEYYEPAAIPSSTSPPNAAVPYATATPSATATPRFPNGHSSADELGAERFYDRGTGTRPPPETDYRRPGYHDNSRGRNRDRSFRNGPTYVTPLERHRPSNNAWSSTYDTSSTRYTTNQPTDIGSSGIGGGNSGGSVGGGSGGSLIVGGGTGVGSISSSSGGVGGGGYSTPTDANSSCGGKTIVPKKTTTTTTTTSTTAPVAASTTTIGGSRSPSPSGSTSSRSPSRSRSRSSSSSSSSTSSSGSGSRKSRRQQASGNAVVHSDDRRPLSICVRNLPLRSSDTSLKDGLYHEYKKHGKVRWVKVVGQNSERHAIVCFKKPEDVEKALEVSYEKFFFGCKIEVAPYQGYDVEDNDLRPYEAEIDEFHPKATRTLFIGNLEKDVTASDLRKHFDQFGEIIEIDIKKQGAVSSYAFCQYSDIVSVVKAIRTMDGEHLNNNRIKLGFGKSMPTPCVWVDGVSDSVNDKYLNMQFDPFGSVVSTFCDREKGQALIFYDQVVNAQTAVNKMRGMSLRGRKIQVDFASRECQEAFFENLEKQGLIFERPGIDDRRDTSSRTFESISSSRFSRYETPTRPRTASYSSRTGAAGGTQCNATGAVPSPGTPGPATPRGTGARSRLTRYDYYDQNSAADYPDRHFRNYDEYSQGSGASHEDNYEHEYAYHESPSSHLEPIETKFPPAEHVIVPFVQPDIRNLQKERVLLLEQLEDCPSSGDEVGPKKRLKLEHMDGTISSEVIIEANRDHRKVMEVRRFDANFKHISRRPSVDGRMGPHERGYLPHAVCKRRKTAGSDSGRVHHYESSESVGGSRPGTPLCDERPEHFAPTEPRRIPRDREGPLTLPLPRFASLVMGKASISIAGIKGQKENVLSSPPPAVTSPRISNAKPPSPTPVPPPASPPPRPPSLSSNSSDSDGASPSPSLEERIKSLDEKYEKWSGSRALSTAGVDALSKMDTSRDRFRFRHKLLDLDLKELQPSEIVKSVMAKRSVFDEDSKRLENVGEKYEPKDFNLFPRMPVQTTVPATSSTLATLPLLKVCTTPTMLSPRATPSTPTLTTVAAMATAAAALAAAATSSTTAPSVATSTLLSAGIVAAMPTEESSNSSSSSSSTTSSRAAAVFATAAKGLQYPFPTHPPMQPSPTAPPQPPQPQPQPPTCTTPSTTAPRSTHGDSNRLKPCANAAPSDSWTPSKVSVNKSAKVNTNTNNNNSSSSSSSSNSSSSSSSSSSSANSEHNSNNSNNINKNNANIPALPPPPPPPSSRRDSSDKQPPPPPLPPPSAQHSLRHSFDHDNCDNDKVHGKDHHHHHPPPSRRLSEYENVKEKEEKEERERKEKEEKEREDRERKEKEDRERRDREERERKEREEKEKREKEKEERDRKEREEQIEKERERRREEERRKEEVDKERRKEEKRREAAEAAAERKLQQQQQQQQLQQQQQHDEEKEVEKERRRDEKYDNHEKRHRENHSETSTTTKHNNLDSSKSHRTKEPERRKDHHNNTLSRSTLEIREGKDRPQDSKDRHSETTKERHLESSTKAANEMRENRHSVDGNSSSNSSSNNNKDKDQRMLFESSRHYEHQQSTDKERGEPKSLFELRDSKERSSVDSKEEDRKSSRKERNNSLQPIGSKRRISSIDSFDSSEEPKKLKMDGHSKKIGSDRRDSKDKKHKDKNCDRKHNHVNSSSGKDRDREHKRIKSEKKLKRSRESPPTPNQTVTPTPTSVTVPIPTSTSTPTLTSTPTQTPTSSMFKELASMDKEFMAGLELVEVEKQKQMLQQRRERDKREYEERKKESVVKHHHLQQHQHHHQHLQHQREDTPKSGSDERKRIRKMTNSSDNNSDSDEPKKHSIFDIVDDEPAYISMYDKVKARSCKNMQKQEEEKRQEKIKAKFSQLKQSRAKREEKKRSTSWDEDSDSDPCETSRRKSRMNTIISSDEDDDNEDSSKLIQIFSDSDPDRVITHLKAATPLSSSDEDHHHIKRRASKHLIVSDTSDDEYNKIIKRETIKSDLFSDNEDQGFADSEEKYKLKINEDFETKYKDMKEFSPVEVKEEEESKFNNRRIYDNSSGDDIKVEIRKKHKKRQKRQKNSQSGEESSKPDDEERSKNSEKRKQHSKKDKKRDKTKDQKKSKKSKSESKDRRDGKMENIFGSLSDDSDGQKDDERKPSVVFMEGSSRFVEENTTNAPPPPYASDSETQNDEAASAALKMEEQLKAEEKERIKSEEKERLKSEEKERIKSEEKERIKLEEKERLKSEEKERILREEHRKRKERKRREKEKQRLREEQQAANNDNSMDFVDLGKQLEDNIKDDSNEIAAEVVHPKATTKEDATKDSEEPRFVADGDQTQTKQQQQHHHHHQKEQQPQQEVKERKDKEERKKKKRKKSKDEKQRHHHHHHHHDKNKVKSPEVVKKETRVEDDEDAVVLVKVEEKQCAPSIFDSPPIVKSLSTCLLDIKISPQIREPLISPIPKTPTSSKEKKRDKFIPGFGVDMDEKIHENAVKSISDFEVKQSSESLAKTQDTDVKSEKVELPEEKPRVVISQEETEDAVAALLGESFSSQFDDCYTETQSPPLDDSNAQDDEEMRQAVQSLNSNELEIKPDTPQSEHDLQIDTDTEEQDEVIGSSNSTSGLRYETPKTPEMLDFSQPPKTPDIPSYYRKDEKSMPNIGSPPSLTPIKAAIDTNTTKRSVEEKIRNFNVMQTTSVVVSAPAATAAAAPTKVAAVFKEDPPPLKPVKMHNMPAQMPFPPVPSKPESKANPTASTLNRLSIATTTPVVVSKPMQQQMATSSTVVVPPQSTKPIQQQQQQQRTTVYPHSYLPPPVRQLKSPPGLVVTASRTSYMQQQFEGNKTGKSSEPPKLISTKPSSTPPSPSPMQSQAPPLPSPTPAMVVTQVNKTSIQAKQSMPSQPPMSPSPTTTITKTPVITKTIGSPPPVPHVTQIKSPVITSSTVQIKQQQPLVTIQKQQKMQNMPTLGGIKSSGLPTANQTITIKPQLPIMSQQQQKSVVQSVQQHQQPQQIKQQQQQQQIIMSPSAQIKPIVSQQQQQPPPPLITKPTSSSQILVGGSKPGSAPLPNLTNFLVKPAPVPQTTMLQHHHQQQSQQPINTLVHVKTQIPAIVSSMSAVPNPASLVVPPNTLKVTTVNLPQNPSPSLMIKQSSMPSAVPPLPAPVPVPQPQTTSAALAAITFTAITTKPMVLSGYGVTPPPLINKSVKPHPIVSTPPVVKISPPTVPAASATINCIPTPPPMPAVPSSVVMATANQLQQQQQQQQKQHPLTAPLPTIIISTSKPPFMPVIQEAPKLAALTLPPPPPSSPLQKQPLPIIQMQQQHQQHLQNLLPLSSVQQQHSTTPPSALPTIGGSVVKVKEVVVSCEQQSTKPTIECKNTLTVVTSVPTRTSTPSPVIVQTPKEPEKPVVEEAVKSMAIEQVTEELNLLLKHDEVKPTPAPVVDTAAAKRKERAASSSAEQPEVISVIKEVEKFDEEKADTESTVSDISKERLSADIKEDALDSKEDSDYWSAKEVNIDSVIKKVDALCSADELSDRSSDVGKDEWLDEKSVKDEKEIIVEQQQPQQQQQLQQNVEKIEEKHEEELLQLEDEKEVSAIRSGRRGGRVARGRRGRGAAAAAAAAAASDRSGVQTRRGKVKEVTTTRGRGRGGRIKTDRKLTKSESETNDIYEFRDDSDESNKDRPRLILTIKSPAIANSNGNAAVIKEVVQPPPPPEPKEEFASPANTRKSRRLQEKDVARNTVDDTIEDVVKNTVLTRAAASAVVGTRRSARQQTANPRVMPETLKKSPRGGGKKKDRRASETTDDSSEEKVTKNNDLITIRELPAPQPIEEPAKAVEVPAPVPSPQPQILPPPPPPKVIEVREKPHEGLKAAMLRRVKGEMNQEPMTLIDPVTGLLTPMRECEEGRYIPLASQQQQQQQQQQQLQLNEQKQNMAAMAAGSSAQQHLMQLHIQQQQQQQQPEVVAKVVIKPNKPLSLKAHVLSKAVAQQQQASASASAPTINVPLSSYQATPPTNISPRLIVQSNIGQQKMPMPINKGVIQPPVSPNHQVLISKQQSQQTLLKQQQPPPQPPQQPMMGNAQLMTHKTQQPSPMQVQQQQQQQIVGKNIPILKQQQQQQHIMVASPPLKQHLLSMNAAATATATAVACAVQPQQQSVIPQQQQQQQHVQIRKTVMDAPKVEVSMAGCVMVSRPNDRLVAAAAASGSYEASLGEGIPHYPASVAAQLRPPPEMQSHHYIHPMYRQYLRQQTYHIPRSPMIAGGMEKVGDGQEGEEAPVTSPHLEDLRRPGSVGGMQLSGRSSAVPHSLQSPHDRATDSPQVAQVYNMLPSRMQYTPYYEPGEPPPAHRPIPHGTLAALGSERPLRMTIGAASDRPPLSHLAALTPGVVERGVAAGPPLITDRPPLGGHLPDRPISSATHMPDTLATTHMPPDHGMTGLGLGAAGNIMGAVARHGADAPTTQRGLQAATPPHASQVPPQAESLLMLLKQYPLMWQGLLALKNDQAAVQMYFVSGNESVAKLSLPKNTDGSTPPLRIFQRMRLEPPQVEGVARKMQMENEHCMLLALPCGHDHMDVLKQSTNLSNGFITYLQQKQAAGIVNVAAPGTTQPPAYVVHIFPSCDFVNENLRRIAPSLLERVADIAHLLIVITTV